MTTIHYAHQRTSPSHLKRSTVRVPRPTALPRTLSNPKLSSGRAARLKAVEPSAPKDDNDDDNNNDMASSFLQYCAMCEKQILVPNNSILYCSESCRRRDGSKGPSADTYLAAYTSTFPSHSPTAETIDVFGQTTRCLTSRRKITSPTTSSSIPPELHNAKADLDPTEWKPDIETRASSEAFEYLAQFHRSTPSPVPRRPGLHGRSTTSILMARTAPSLSHTPTTSTSSEESEAGTPYDFVANMGQAKQHEPVVEIKSVEMGKQSLGAMSVEGKPVRKNPTASPMLGDLSYEKQLVDGSMQRLDGSLKKLLHLREVEGE